MAGLKFVTRKKRDQLARRLADMANDMLRSWDQGGDGRVRVTEEMVEDIRAAAAIVGLSEIQGEK